MSQEQNLPSLSGLRRSEKCRDQVGAGLPATESGLRHEMDEHIAENIPY